MKDTKKYTLVYSLILGHMSAFDYGYHNQKQGSFFTDNADLVDMINNELPNELMPEYINNDNLLILISTCKDMINYLNTKNYEYINNEHKDVYVYVGARDNYTNTMVYSKSFNITSMKIRSNNILHVEGFDL